MDNTNIVIDGTYKGCKIVFDKTNKSIHLKHKKKSLPLNGNITSIGITKDKIGTENIHYFQIENSTEKIYCLLDFNTYLLLILLGMKVSASCVLGKI